MDLLVSYRLDDDDNDDDMTASSIVNLETIANKSR